MAVVTAAAVTAGAAAYGAYSQNKAQKEAANAAKRASETPTTTTRSPYAPTEPHIQRAIEEAGRLYDAGLHQKAAQALRRVPGASEAFQSIVGDVTDRARNPSPTLQAGQQFVQDLLGGGNVPPPAGLTEQDVQGAKRFWGPGDTAEDAIRKATAFARQNPDSSLGRRLAERESAASAAGPAGPFARNPIYNELYGSVTGTNMDRSYDLLADFIQGGGGAGFTPSGGSLPQPAGGDQGMPAGPDYGSPQWQQFAEKAAALGFDSPEKAAAYVEKKGGGGALAQLYQQARAATPAPQAAQGGGGGTTGSGGRIPDTMAQGGFYADEARKFFDPSVLDPANDPTLQPYIDALKAQMGDAFNERADLIGDRFSASNTFNSSARSLALGDASGEMDQALSAELARTYMGARESALARQMGLLQGISQRDLAAMGDLTQRYGIDAGSAAQETALDFERERLGAQTDLQTRAQNLQAIMGIQGGDQYGMDLLAGLGGALDSRQFGALGAIPGLEGTEQGWYGMALGGQQGVSGQRQAAAGARAGAAADAALAPSRDLDDYLRRIMGPGTAFGSSTSTGPAAPGWNGPSSGEALAGGLLGGAAAGLGTYMQYGGGGGSYQPATYSNGTVNGTSLL